MEDNGRRREDRKDAGVDHEDSWIFAYHFCLILTVTHIVTRVEFYLILKWEYKATAEDSYSGR